MKTAIALLMAMMAFCQAAIGQDTSGAMRQAISRWPDLARPGKPLYQGVLTRRAKYEREQPDLFEKPNWPNILVDQVISEMHSSMHEAISKWPDVAVDGSPMKLEMASREAWYESNDPSFFNYPSWPLSLAAQVAAKLGIHQQREDDTAPAVIGTESPPNPELETDQNSQNKWPKTTVATAANRALLPEVRKASDLWNNFVALAVAFFVVGTIKAVGGRIWMALKAKSEPSALPNNRHAQSRPFSGWILFRDVVIVYGILFAGGVAVYAASNWGPTTAALALSNIVFGTIAFTWVGCMARRDRWFHLFIVCGIVWVLGLANIMVGATAQDWLMSTFSLGFVTAVGGGISFALSKPDSPAIPTPSALPKPPAGFPRPAE